MSLRHTKVFKSQILALKQAGHKESELAKRYNLGHSTISRWESEFAKDKPGSDPLSKSELKDIRIHDLESDVTQLKEELEILKAAVSLLCKKKVEK
jgi:transposase